MRRLLATANPITRYAIIGTAAVAAAGTWVGAAYALGALPLFAQVVERTISLFA